MSTEINREYVGLDILATDELKTFATLLLDNGMTLFTTIYKSNELEKKTYFYYSDGANIAYAQQEHFGGIGISTEHKPCKEYGTGFKITDRFQGLINPTLEDAKRGFIKAPGWANDLSKISSTKLNAIVKYKSIDEYLDSAFKRIARTVFITNNLS